MPEDGIEISELEDLPVSGQLDLAFPLMVPISAKKTGELPDTYKVTPILPGTAAEGDLAGTYPSPTIKLGAVVENRIRADAVTEAKIKDGAVTAAKLSAAGTDDQVLSRLGPDLVWKTLPVAGQSAMVKFVTPGTYSYSGRPNQRYLCYAKGGGGNSGTGYRYGNDGHGTGGQGGRGGGLIGSVLTGGDGLLFVVVGGPGSASIITSSASSGLTALPGSNGGNGGSGGGSGDGDDGGAAGAAGVAGSVGQVLPEDIIFSGDILPGFGLGGAYNYAVSGTTAVVGTGGAVMILV